MSANQHPVTTACSSLSYGRDDSPKSSDYANNAPSVILTKGRRIIRYKRDKLPFDSLTGKSFLIVDYFLLVSGTK